MDQNFSLTPFPSFQSCLMPLHTKEAGGYHLHYTVSDGMQILDVFNSFPLTVEDAAAMGLIDGVKPKLDAIHYVTHHSCGQAAAAQQTSTGVSHQDVVAGRQTSEQSTVSHPVLPAGDQMLAAAQRFRKGTVHVTTVNDDSSSTEACTNIPFTANMAAVEDEKACQPKDTGNKPGIALIRISGEGQLPCFTGFLHATLFICTCTVCLLAGHAHAQQQQSWLAGLAAMLTSFKMSQCGNSSALCYTAGMGLLAALFKILTQDMAASGQHLLHAYTSWHTAHCAEHL